MRILICKAFIMMGTLLFFTIEAVQADPFVSESDIVRSDENEDESSAADQQILDGNIALSLPGDDPVIGDTLEIEEGGEISTVIDDEHGVEITGDNNEVNNNGTITTTGEGADGINLKGMYNTIINYGKIQTHGENTSGIRSKQYSDFNTIFNYGSIIAKYGIVLERYSDFNTIFNYDSIIAKETGIGVDGNSNTIFNYGYIEAGRLGISSMGDDIIIINGVDGEILTGGEWSHGISIAGNNALIINNGTIINRANGFSIGILSHVGINSIIINNGTIIMGNEDGTTLNPQGIKSEDADAFILNTGRIESMGEYAVGIWSDGDNSVIINSGTIETIETGFGTLTEEAAIGIDGYNVYVLNSGTLSTTGIKNHGIQTYGDYTNIINSGTILTTGEGSYGIRSEADHATISNYGLISVANPSINYAIKGDAGEETVNLFPGSWIFGRIDLGMGEDTANIYADNNPAIAKTLTFEETETINYYGRVGVINRDRLTTIDPTEHAVKATVLNSLTTGLHSVIHTRLNNIRPNTGRIWFDSFSSYRKRETEENLFAYDHAYKGGMGGVEKVYENSRIGVSAGFSRTNVEANSESFRTDTNSYLAGIYGLYDFGFLKLQASLFGGSEFHKNTRMVFDNMQGFENARSDFESYFLSHSIMISKDYELTKRFILRPSVETVCSTGWYEDYQEHGSTNSNIGIDRKTLSAMNCKAGLMTTYRLADWCQISVSGGGGARYTDDNSTKGDFEGSPFRIKSTNDDSVYSGYASANLNVDIKQQLIMNLNVLHSEVSGGETNNFFTVGFMYNF